MALKNNWEKLQDAIPGMENSGDEISVVPINRIADAVIELEEHAEGTQEKLSSEQINNIDKIPDISRTASDAQNVAYSAHNVASATYPIATSAKELAEFAETAAAGAYSQSTTALKGVDACYQAIGRAESLANEAKAVALGRATGYVFDTYEDMLDWLDDFNNVRQLVQGDNLYIRDVDVPDYWWDGENAQPLETQKVNLTEYAKKDELNKKQDILISGTNIKTVSGKSILGEGNIEIQNANYELIEKVIIGYSITTTKPDDWEENYISYYKNTGTLINPTYIALTEFEEWVDGAYYSYSSDGGVINRVKEPDGTDYNFSKILLQWRDASAFGQNINGTFVVQTSNTFPTLNVGQKINYNGNGCYITNMGYTSIQGHTAIAEINSNLLHMRNYAGDYGKVSDYSVNRILNLNNEKLTGFKLVGTSTAKITSNTIVYIYGVRV